MVVAASSRMSRCDRNAELRKKCSSTRLNPDAVALARVVVVVVVVAAVAVDDEDDSHMAMKHLRRYMPSTNASRM